MKSLIISFLITAIFSIALLYADEVTERQNQLEAIKAELESKRAQFDSLGQMEKDAASRLREIEQQAALSGQLLLKLNRESERLKQSLSSQKVKLQSTEALREERQTLLKRRLRQMYKMGEVPSWIEILAASDPSAALASYRNIKTLLEYDRRLLESYKKLSSTIETGVKTYQGDLNSLSGLQSDQQNELERRQKTMLARKKLVDRVKKDRNEIEKSISRLEDDAREVSGIIENLRAQSTIPEDTLAFPGLANSKGNLIWPAQGKIMRPYGLLKDSRGIELSNPGIDIQAKSGADVLAAAGGEVIYISWLRGYGQFIIVNHGRGYYTLYANLSDILVETGDKVRAGELIALVGDSGSLEGPKLHFEVRYKKEQLDPTEWLR
jgi:murein hydrolase activator